VRIGNFDPALAPVGSAVLTSAIEADGPYWIELRERDREQYKAEKARIGDAVVRALDRRYPGLSEQVEMVDGATPSTTVRHTGSWRAGFEGFMPTPAVPDEGAAAGAAGPRRLLHGRPVGAARRRTPDRRHDGSRNPAAGVQPGRAPVPDHAALKATIS